MERKRRASRKSPCPKYVVCRCPKIRLNDEGKCRETDADYAIEKLRGLVSDPITSCQVTRISQLLFDYLLEIGDEGYPVKHLPGVMQVLGFLACKSQEVKEYESHLDRMLEIAKRPPLLKRMSENLVSTVVMEQYFTLLGYLMTILPDQKQHQQICDAIDGLLIARAELTNITAVKMDLRHRAVENSCLPNIVVQLLENALPKVYPMYLELASILASVSFQCCYKMLEAGVLNILLIRMDLPYATQMPCTKPPEMLLKGEEYPWDTMIVITGLLWNLMRSMLPPSTPPENLRHLSSPKQCAMWGLSYSFKRQIFHSQYYAISLKIRNDIAALILAGIVMFPSWNLASSGIAQDIIGFLSAIESNVTKIWSKNVMFSDCEENIFFKRILLVIVAHLVHIDVYVYIMKKEMIMRTILDIIESCNEKNTKHPSSIVLMEHAMHVLSLLTSRLAGQFVKCNGTQTYGGIHRALCAMIEERILNAKFDECLVMIFARMICSIVLYADDFLLEDFRKHNTISLLIDLIDRVLTLETFTIRQQRILTLLLIALEGVLKKKSCAQRVFGERGIKTVKWIFAKCKYPKNEDFQVDQRLLLATGSYVWECLIRCPINLQTFLKADGLYSMLDIIEIASYPVKCLYLGALTDMCDYTFCGPFLCTWRGIDKQEGLMSLLTRIWRQEEDKLGIERLPDGCIADRELPQMGRQQWFQTYRAQLTADSSPTIVDMFGSVRPKVFSILKIIKRDEDKYETAMKHYKILFKELPARDHITLECVKMYLRLKLGQMWTELSKYLMQIGIAPLIMDAELIAHMVQWHRSWGIFIEKNQKKLVATSKRKDACQEVENLVILRDVKLMPTFDALDEVDYIRRTTCRSYMLRKKKYQRRQVNKALSFPADADSERCHRTFSQTTNVTVVIGQHQTIDTSHLKDLTRDLQELLPVSPPDSPPHTETSVRDDDDTNDDLNEDDFNFSIQI